MLFRSVILAASSCRTAITDSVQNSPVLDVSTVLPASCIISQTKMVSTGAATANGMITVVGDATNLKGDTSATENSISMTPFVGIGAAATALVGTTDGGKTISEWKCGPAATNGIRTKYLPGSCKGL